MADIKFTSSLDDRGFKRGVAGIQNAARMGAARVGQEFTKSFNQQVKKYLGVGFLIASVRSLTIALDKAQKIKLESITTGMSPERLQAMAFLAERFGAAWGKLSEVEQLGFADELLASGDFAFYTAQQLDTMAEASLTATALFAPLKTAGVEAFIAIANAIQGTTNKLAEFIFYNSALVRTGFDFEKAQEEMRLYRETEPPSGSASSTLVSIGNRMRQSPSMTARGDTAGGATRLSPVAPMARQSDSLQRIGLFVGGAGNPAIAIGREQLQVLRQILVLQRQTLQETKRL